ncbi:hypothetical protein BST81_17430 [Leptolyngbya sp. 'hensonii']|uniref:DUF3611 family protein n=1 Tax=Leptolyngbya sp. 'hensonii' TaxID=1922337 RepID=UPI00094FDB2E|nr:DUF3611 family protein [Leptolyngbya sp. 'hensonii']OLP17133.1 hypothetical protein BST81_17430 [Leptolyngbya sp. 'hensonii']
MLKPGSPPTVQQVARNFRFVGWISFWVQLVVAVVASFILMFAGVSNNIRPNTAPDPGRGSGLFLTVCGLLLLYGGIYWAFRYTRLARRLVNVAPEDRPKKADTIQSLRIGLLLNLGGMGLTLLGAGATVGALFFKASTQQGGFVNDPSRLIQALDIFVVQANTNILLGLFIGLFAGLFLLNRIIR